MNHWWKRLVEPQGVLAAMAVFYGVASACVGAYVVVSDRAETLRRVELSAQSITRLLDEHANRTLDAAEMMAVRLGDRTVGQIGDPAMSEQMLKASPHLANLYVVDRAGQLVVDARDFHARGSDFANKPWVAALLSGKAAEPVIGPVEFDEASRSYVFPVARRVRDSSGRAVAVAAAMVDVDYFKRFYQGLDIGPVPALGIYTLDGAILVRQPLKLDDIGRDMSGNPMFTEHLPKAPSGTYTGRSAYDGVLRVVSYRTIQHRGLLVWVSVGADEALDLWRMRAARVALLVLAGLVVMIALTLLLLRQLGSQRQAARALKALNHDLERSNADLEQFAYIASHDLKEPLRNISSYVQLLQRRYEGKLDHDADAFIGYTVDGVRRMQAIINELLAYSRVGTGKLHMAQIQAGASVSTALAQLKTVIGEAQAAVEVKGPLPVVSADPPQLASLFQNLIANGIKYRRPEVRPEITIGAEDRGGEWAFYVADNGIGIESQYHDQIFELFKRLHPRDRYGGTGIGLATCKRVVGRHGGRIWVESAGGRGSTFWFTLPKTAKAS